MTLPVSSKLSRPIIYWACFGIILAIALYLRIDFLRSVSHEMSHDATNYSAMARQLIDQGVYGYNSSTPNAYVMPGYPLFLVLNYLIADANHWNPLALTRYVQLLLSMFTLIMIFLLTKMLSKHWIPALTAAFITAIYPPFVWANGAILTEVLATFFFIWYLLWQLHAMKVSSRRHALMAGILLGLTVLVRPEFLPVAFVLYAFAWWKRRERQLSKLFMYSMLGLILALSPWWIRNAVTLNEFIPLATQTNPVMAGTFPYNNFNDNMVDRVGKTEIEVTKERLKIGFTEHPALFLWWYTFGKWEYIYSSMYLGSGHYPFYPVILSGKMLHDSIVWFGVASCIISLLQIRQQLTQITMAIVFMSLIRLAFVPDYRYNFTVMPLFIILGCATAFKIYSIMRNVKEGDTNEGTRHYSGL